MTRAPKNEPVELSIPHKLTKGLITRLACPPNMDQAFLRDADSPGLKVRVTASGFKSFTFEGKLNNQTIRMTIGNVNVWTIESARTEANRFRVELDRGIDPREAERQRSAERAAIKEQETAALKRKQYSLAALLDDYCEHQKSIDRSSYSDARSIFKLHITDCWPDIAALPATDITEDHIADMMRRLHATGKGRTANKLRSYVHAAYMLAITSRTKGHIPERFKEYQIRHNPASDTQPDELSNKSAKKPLTLDEMKRYWHAVKEVEGLKGAVLRLHLLTGAQRLAQLVKLQNTDIGVDDQYIVLIDTKGRPGKGSREHELPLTLSAAIALRDCHPAAPWALSTDGGKTHLSANTLSGWAKDVAEKIGIEDFQTKRLRSGVETALASVKISETDRGRLQSHGVSGVQSQHYDGHNYEDEKLEAMMVLEAVLEGLLTPKARTLSMEERRHPLLRQA